MTRTIPWLVRGAAAAMIAWWASACDPCTGVASCARGNYLAVNGQIVDPVNGRGIDGVQIDVVRVGGLALDADSLHTVTSEGGHWRVELAPRDSGAVQVDVVVSPPGYASYRVRGVSLQTRAHGGDATVLEHWVPEPYFAYAGEFFLNGTTDTRVEGATVEFRRTGGVALRGEGIATGVYRTTTDAGGRFALFPTGEHAVFPVTLGAVTGDFFVQLPAPYRTSTIRGVVLMATPVFRQQAGIVRYAVGPGVP